MKISRKTYADLYGPTVGDSVRLGDTNLWVTPESDSAVPGDEVTFGGGGESDPRWDGSVPAWERRLHGSRDYERTDCRLLGYRQGRCRCEVGKDCGDW